MDHNTVRRGITLIVVGVTVVMVLVFSLSAYFTPASAGATFAASLCGDGSAPDYGFTYDNLGIPKNLENLATIADPSWADPGLGGFLMDTAGIGKFKVPTLRNVDLRPTTTFVKAYGHNGYFKPLEELVHFYNTQDIQPWPAPEVSQNMNTEFSNLRLNKTHERWIVEFLKTLSDGDIQ